MTDEAFARIAEAEIYDGAYDFEGVEVVHRDDALYWTAPSRTSWANRVAWVRCDAARVDDAVEEVSAFFRSRGRDFTWCVGPSSEPRDLGAHLVARGFTLLAGVKARLMTAPLPLDTFTASAAVRVEDARDEDSVSRYVRFLGLEADPDAVGRDVARRLRSLEARGARRGFLLATVDGALAGTAEWRDSSDGRVVYLAGALTSSAHQRRGVYSTLTRERLRRAYERGCTLAALRADPRTSAPILAKRGFRDHGAVAVYASPRA